MDALPTLPDAPDAPDDDPAADAHLLARVADEIVRRRLTTPAILFLESVKPLNVVGSQMLSFLDPIMRLFLTVPEVTRFARLLERRDTIERLICDIEAAQDASDQESRP
ncbi:MAG: hypothetical protein EB084_11500 [Proteobacteria bacterium]|nr:hypothetical protein [Pseudomonadota bacterium]